MYTKEVMKHFENPKYMGEITDADGTGKMGNPVCGDVMHLFIKIKKKADTEYNDEIIEDIKVKTFGCVAAIATSSMITDLAMGKTLEEAKKITRDNVKDALIDLPKEKIHCSNLAADALHKAIEDYEKKKT